ncbi:MAG: DUF5009 domain-containing protein [Bacteroidota bacterium]
MTANIESKQSGQRLACVDALRGFDMLWIIGGGEIVRSVAKAKPDNRFLGWLSENFDHQWGQFGFYDLIMPLFLFIVGVVMPLAFTKRLEKGESKKEIYKHVIKRVIKLYIFGLIASGHLLTFDITRIHLWTDTLHAIAAGYLVSSILILELRLKWQIIVTVGLLLLYWIIMTLVPIPGVGAGIFEQKTNLALYIDDKVLGHFQEGEGWTYILTNITFVCSVMLGTFAGRILLGTQTEKKKIYQLLLLGILCMMVGKLWGFVFPIIHHIWTSSLVLFAGGLSCLLLVAFYIIIDVLGYKKWILPFTVIGMNAIAVYVATHLFDFKLLGNVLVGGLTKWVGPWDDALKASASLAVVWLILYWMYQKKTFVKI